MRCPRCAGEQFVKAGFDRAKRQLHRCTTCRHRQTVRSASAFCGYRCPDDVIALAVRWYVRFRLPYAVMWSCWRNGQGHLVLGGVVMRASAALGWAA